MQQTEQFKLNQWQKDDRILMEDFNADNLKIETALAGKPGKWELLRTIIAGTSGGFNLPGGWGAYESIIVWFHPYFKTLDETESITWTLVGVLSHQVPNILCPAQVGPAMIWLFPMGSGENPIRGLFLANGATQMISTEIPFDHLSGYYINSRKLVNSELTKTHIYVFGRKS